MEFSELIKTLFDKTINIYQKAIIILLLIGCILYIDMITGFSKFKYEKQNAEVLFTISETLESDSLPQPVKEKLRKKAIILANTNRAAFDTYDFNETMKVGNIQVFDLGKIVTLQLKYCIIFLPLFSWLYIYFFKRIDDRLIRIKLAVYALLMDALLSAYFTLISSAMEYVNMWFIFLFSVVTFLFIPKWLRKRILELNNRQSTQE